MSILQKLFKLMHGKLTYMATANSPFSAIHEIALEGNLIFNQVFHLNTLTPVS